MALGRRARRRVGRFKRRAAGRRFFKRGPGFRGKRRFGTKRLIRRFRGGGKRSQLKFFAPLHGNPLAPTAWPSVSWLVLFGMNIPVAVLGTRAGRESTKVRWKRYTWDWHIGAATTDNLSAETRCTDIWEIIIWWFGDTLSLVATPDLIFTSNANGYLRNVSGFAINSARNYKVLRTKHHKMGHYRDAVLVGSGLPKEGVADQNGFNGVSNPLCFHSRGSISLMGKVSRYVDATVAEPISGILLHYFVHGSNYAVAAPTYFGHQRFSFYDD